MDGQMKGEGVTNMFNRKQVLPAAIHTHEYLTFRGNINQHHVYFITALRAQNPSWKMSLMNNVKYRYVHVQKQRIHTQVPCFHHGLKGEKFDPIKYRFCRQQLWHKSTQFSLVRQLFLSQILFLTVLNSVFTHNAKYNQIIIRVFLSPLFFIIIFNKNRFCVPPVHIEAMSQYFQSTNWSRCGGKNKTNAFA